MSIDACADAIYTSAREKSLSYNCLRLESRENSLVLDCHPLDGRLFDGLACLLCVCIVLYSTFCRMFGLVCTPQG
jgi:hypothetical protein